MFITAREGGRTRDPCGEMGGGSKETIRTVSVKLIIFYLLFVVNVN